MANQTLDAPELPAEFQAPILDHMGLAKAIAARRRSLGMTQLDLDHEANLQSGYAGKLECGIKHYGAASLPAILAVLGLKLMLVEDEGRKVRRQPAQYRPQRQGQLDRRDVPAPEI